MNSTIKRSTPPRKLSPRTAAKRKAAGESVIRSTIAGPRKQVKRRNAKRKASEFARTFHSVERVQWVKSLPCFACVLVEHRADCGPIENAHVTDDGTKGMGRRAGFACIVPLGRKHHQAFDCRLAPFDADDQREFIARQAPEIEAAYQRFVAAAGPL